MNEPELQPITPRILSHMIQEIARREFVSAMQSEPTEDEIKSLVAKAKEAWGKLCHVLSGLVASYVRRYGDGPNIASLPCQITFQENKGIEPQGYAKLTITFKLEDLDTHALHGLAELLYLVQEALTPYGLSDVLLESYFPTEQVTIKAVGWFQLPKQNS